MTVAGVSRHWSSDLMIQDIISIIATTSNVHSMSKVTVFISITLSSSMLSNYHNRRVTKTNYKED